MRLYIKCNSRLGICAEILDILVNHEIDLRGIEIDPSGEIYLNFPNLEFEEFQHLMPEMRMIPGVHDVSLVPYMPLEREQKEMQTLLETLPEPVISIDSKGYVVLANDAALDILNASHEEVRGKLLKTWVKGFNFNKWLNHPETTSDAANVQLKGRTFLADVYPVHIDQTEGEPLFAGGVITFKSPERLGRQMTAYHKQTGQFEMLIAESQGMKRVIRQAKRMSGLDAPLLITGETGTGKELLAKACHQHSLRKDKPFLVLNCAALPDNVAESELFGYAAGAFEGATSEKKGIVELAEGGTVFLDEIGDMSELLQSKFLRLLQDGSYRRVGDEAEYTADVRIICATQADLLDLCQSGKFREDLFYRLNVLSLHIPALRERKSDIMPMAERFIARFAEPQRQRIKMSQACQNAISQYPWPGNVRQMENALLRAVSLTEGDTLEPEHLQLPSFTNGWGYVDENFEGSLDEAMKRFESELLKRLYPAYPSSRQLGKKLGVSHTAIANKLREYRIGKHAS
ncbi:transcriptional regulator TyrR [Reinekea marina]|uniref:HTH-type transcriptional regulatory protein TyrR n=1 Tax=Reinekea marina TaxID=1310421 RepID=A0ABV7WWB8_9GAMM|nr:transcriptional regulator TyrR [Reinekea marina]MDN3649981.1 transcriptional regulator TyrR [Reinekea marina]